MTEEVPSRRRHTSARSPIENALRYIGAQRSGRLAELLETAIEWPGGDIGVALRPLTEPTSILAELTANERAKILDKLIRAGVEHPSVGPNEYSRERRVLRAALRFRDPDIEADWAATLSDRWEQLKALEHVFPKISTNTTQPMEAAWTRAVRKLEEYLNRRFAQLTTLAEWEQVKQQCGDNRQDPNHDEELESAELAELRPASEHAQPFFVNLLVTTVFLKERTLARRVAERVVTAQADDVDYYIARTYAGDGAFNRNYVPVQALWGCTAEHVLGDPVETRLRFPRPLQRGEQAYFAAEALLSHNEPSTAGSYDWINVEIDHHGIAKGKLHHGGLVPLSGLTIRVRFDDACTPVAAWYYAEATEYERNIEPPAGDKRLLEIVGGEVRHTFAQVCQPRENYGIGVHWGP